MKYLVLIFLLLVGCSIHETGITEPQIENPTSAIQEGDNTTEVSETEIPEEAETIAMQRILSRLGRSAVESDIEFVNSYTIGDGWTTPLCPVAHAGKTYSLKYRWNTSRFFDDDDPHVWSIQLFFDEKLNVLCNDAPDCMHYPDRCPPIKVQKDKAMAIFNQACRTDYTDVHFRDHNGRMVWQFWNQDRCECNVAGCPHSCGAMHVIWGYVDALTGEVLFDQRSPHTDIIPLTNVTDVNKCKNI